MEEQERTEQSADEPGLPGQQAVVLNREGSVDRGGCYARKKACTKEHKGN